MENKNLLSLEQSALLQQALNLGIIDIDSVLDTLMSNNRDKVKKSIHMH